MRINDIINEAISLTKYTPAAIDAVKSGIVEVVGNFDKILFSKDEKEEIALGVLKPINAKVLKHLANLDYVVADKLEAVGKEMNIPITVKFVEMDSNGEASGLVIYLNKRYLAGIKKLVVDAVDQFTLDNAYAEDELLQAFKLVPKELSKQLFKFQPDFDTRIKRLVSTFIHEAVHAQQNKAQHDVGRFDTEYRSYLAPKSKFNDTILGKNFANSEEEYKIYRASPQEMAAFAHEDALKFIQGVGMDDADYDFSQENINDAMRELQSYVADYFKDKENPKEYRLFKRYSRLVYQEVQRYIENILKKNNQQ